jgi:hypothetical protein
MLKHKKSSIFATVLVLLFCLLSINYSVQCQKKSPTEKFKITEEVLQYKLGDKVIKLIVSKTSAHLSKFVYFNMHDNEDTSVEAAKEIIKKYGGTLIELQNDGKRLVDFPIKNQKFTFDPNRIFTETGIEITLKDYGDYTIEAEKETNKFATNVKNFLKNFQLIIAVHNNTDEKYTIKSYEKDGEYGKDVKLVNINTENDADDFFFVTESRFFNFLKKKNQNAVFQDNDNVTDDGSLSVYCGKNKISYINVESQYGHLKEQTKMLESLQEIARDHSRKNKRK